MLMMRTLCRCLVDWSNIGTSIEWVQSQIPKIVQKYERHYFLTLSQKRETPGTTAWWFEFIDVNTVAQVRSTLHLITYFSLFMTPIRQFFFGEWG